MLFRSIKKEEGEEAKKKKKKKKGVKASEDGDSGASNPLVFSLLSKIFFFFAGRFPFAGRNTPVFGQYDPNRRESAQFGASRHASEPNRRESARIQKRKKKKKLDAVRRTGSGVPRASGRVGRGCGGHFAASEHPNSTSSNRYLKISLHFVFGNRTWLGSVTLLKLLLNF